jgi:hypothetical protein
MAIRFRDKGLRTTFEGMLNDNRISKAEAEQLIKATEDGPGLSKTERKDLEKLLARIGDGLDTDARTAIESFLAGGAGGGSGTGGVTLVSDRAANVASLADISSTFRSELSERAADFSKPEDAFKLFAEYGGRLKALGKDADPRELDAAIESLLDAGRSSPARGYDEKDLDHDTMSDLAEAARGRDAAKFDVRDEETGKIWTTTYWPMAGSGDNDQDGSAGSNLWAKKGPLAKLDELLTSRGMDGQAKALEFERKPALGWLVGDRDTGHMINESRLMEHDAELTTGVDFDGDGKVTAGVKVDFLGADGGFASVRSRNDFVPKATIDGELKAVHRERITDDDGNISFKFFREAGGAELTGAEKASLFYANPVSGDDKADGSMDVGWWGSCDKVALAGVLFKEPLKDSVEIDGVTFTKQDMLGLLTVIANSQADGTDFIGSRFDDKPDILVLDDGTQLNGKFVGVKDETFRGGEDMWRWDGDFMVLSDPMKNDPDKEFTFRELDGKERTVKASEIKHMAREDGKDMSPIEFHSTMLSWLSEGRAAAMDRDAGDHVWNYSFHGATLTKATELTGSERPTEAGHNGAIADDTTVVEFEMEVRFGESNYPRTYRYWMEKDASGKPINAGWKSDNPDFLWRPAGFKGFVGHNERNPFVKPELVKEIYDKFMEQ